MPRTPDTTCSTCGKPCYASRAKAGSAWIPPRTHTCRECRAANVVHGKPSTYNKRKCRCAPCREAWNAECRKRQQAARGTLTRECLECGSGFNPRSNQLLCSPPCQKVYYGRFGTHYSRAKFYGVDYEVVRRLEVFVRDSWTCGICNLPVDSDAAFPDPGSPTLDHIIPLSLGGGHVWANVQLAHFYCNTVKGARMAEAC